MINKVLIPNALIATMIYSPISSKKGNVDNACVKVVLYEMSYFKNDVYIKIVVAIIIIFIITFLLFI